MSDCQKCNGTGEICHSSTNYSACPECGGRGRIYDNNARIADLEEQLDAAVEALRESTPTMSQLSRYVGEALMDDKFNVVLRDLSSKTDAMRVAASAIVAAYDKRKG